MKTYHQLFTLVMLILIVLTAIFIIRIALVAVNDNSINKTPSHNIIHLSNKMPSRSFGEYFIDNSFLNF